MNVPVRPGLLGRLHAQDARALDYVVGRRHPRVDSLMERVTRLGDASVVSVVSVLLLVGGPATRPVGLRAATALLVSHLVVQLLKRTVNRARPRLPVGVGSLIQAPERFSFPSGHAAAALAVGGALATSLAPIFAVPVLVVSLLVGVSRCYLGVHYPGDVLVGWLLALCGLLVAT